MCAVGGDLYRCSGGAGDDQSASAASKLAGERCDKNEFRTTKAEKRGLMRANYPNGGHPLARYFAGLFALVTILLIIAEPVRGADALLELQVGGEKLRGRSLAHNDQVCWLINQSGQLARVNLQKVTGYRQLAAEFRGHTADELRPLLLQEFGTEYEIAVLGSYVVCAQRGSAREYADVFDDTYRAFRHYFSVRGCRFEQPQFPLTAIVFPDFGSYADYCRQDRIPPNPNLRGYYLPSTNRVALYRQENAKLSRTGTLKVQRSALHGSTGGEFRKTMIHEATHQIAFNLGLHSRVGDNPRWVVEGLAMVFESDAIRRGDWGGDSATQRINRERYLHFGEYRKRRPSQAALAKFLGDDQLFQRSVLDAYSEAWALTFYLVETQPSQYINYLQHIAGRDPLKPYESSERIADFQQFFGADLKWFDVQYLRFVDRLL